MNNSHRHLPRLRPVARLDQSWLRFLLLEQFSDSEVNDALVSDDLPPATPTELATFRRALDVPPNFDPGDNRHLSSQAYVQRHGLEIFYRPNGEAATAMLRVLRQPLARQLTEAALLVDVPMRFLVAALAKHLAFYTDVATVRAYARVYFNVAALSRSQVRSAVELRVRHAIMRVVGDEDEGAVRRAVASDGRVVAASLTRSPLAWASVLVSLGWKPPQQNAATTVAELEDLALIRAGEALARGGEEDARRVEGYVGVLERLRALREGLVDPNELLVKTFAGLRLVQGVEQLPTVGDFLARGDDVSPMQEGPSDHEEADELLPATTAR